MKTELVEEAKQAVQAAEDRRRAVRERERGLFDKAGARALPAAAALAFDAKPLTHARPNADPPQRVIIARMLTVIGNNLNGQRGEVIGWDASKEEAAIKLDTRVSGGGPVFLRLEYLSDVADVDLTPRQTADVPPRQQAEKSSDAEPEREVPRRQAGKARATPNKRSRHMPAVVPRAAFDTGGHSDGWGSDQVSSRLTYDLGEVDLCSRRG